MPEWFKINASADVAEIMIYDTIGKNWDGSGIGAESFVEQLNAITAPTINIRLNSNGGDVFDGYAIANAMKRHASEINVYVDGIAASIASIIAISGDSLTMASNSFMMVHKPWTYAIGNEDDFQKQIDLLQKIGDGMAQQYAEKSGQTKDAMLAAMKSETWYAAEEASKMGLCDAVGDACEGIKPAMATYVYKSKTAPKELRRMAASIIRGKAPESPKELPKAVAIEKPTAEELEFVRNLRAEHEADLKLV